MDIMRYSRVKPQVLQVELHPYLTQDPLIKLAGAVGIAVTAYSSFGPTGYVELGADQGVKSLMEQDVVVRAAAEHNKSKTAIV